MIVTKMALPRRTFLRGLGAALALPLLDAMVPALSRRAAQTLAGSVRRLGLRLHPDGDERGGMDAADRGAHHGAVAVAARADAGARSRHRRQQPRAARTPTPPGNHASSNCAFLSCSRAKRTEGSDYELGTTVDQIAARAHRQGDADAVARDRHRL